MNHAFRTARPRTGRYRIVWSSVFAAALLCACGGGGARGGASAATAIPAQEPPANSSGVAMQLSAADGVTIQAMHYPAPAAKALILLFHQGNSNFAEYERIGPRLVKEGFSALAIDERHGGTLFGRVNLTVQARGTSSSNLAALPDLEAAFAWAADQHLPIVVWGSSDSASLVFGLSSKHPDRVRAVLSFSPLLSDVESPGWGEAAAAQTTAPTFVASSGDPAEITAATQTLNASGATLKRQYQPSGRGLHGSSTLDPVRNPQGSEEGWSAVLDFLKAAL